METAERQEQFVQRITAFQSALYGYILSLLPNRDEAEDVLQNTNLAIWRKANDFAPGSDFLAWACTIAYYEVLAHRRKLARDRLVLDDEAIRRIAERLNERLDELDERRYALRDCLSKLAPHQRALLENRYQPDASVQQIAEQMGRSAASISQTIYRIRNALLRCIKGKLQLGHSG